MINYQSNRILNSSNNYQPVRVHYSGQPPQSYNSLTLLICIVFLAMTGCKSAPVLSYSLLTDPDPLRASPAGEDYDSNIAMLTVVATNETGKDITVRNIILTIPTGQGAQALTRNITGVNPTVFIYRLEGPINKSKKWHICKTGDKDCNTGDKNEFIVTTENPEQDGILKTGEGLYIKLPEILINDRPGVWSLTIDETTGKNTTNSMTIQSIKAPFELIVSDLGADPLVVEPGGCTTLYWEGSDGADYWLFDGQKTNKLDSVGNIDDSNKDQYQRYEVCDLKLTTTFYLTATLVGGEYQLPVIRERTVTVIE